MRDHRVHRGGPKRPFAPALLLAAVALGSAARADDPPAGALDGHRPARAERGDDGPRRAADRPAREHAEDGPQRAEEGASAPHRRHGNPRWKRRSADPARPVVQAALAAAAAGSGIAVDELKVTEVQRVTWLDGSLGCPQPDLFYTQALVPGYRILIDAGGQVLDVHADTLGQVLLCPPGLATAGQPR